MKKFLVKCLITFRVTRKNAYFLLAALFIAAIVTHLRGNIKAFRYCLFYSVFLLLLIMVFSIACIIHRKKHRRFKVYLSFSLRRIPGLSRYIVDYLIPAFWIYNIDYYDFREHERFHHQNIPAICEVIDKNLADSDIFIRFIDHGLEPNKSHLVSELWRDMGYNSFTGDFSGNFDYVEYEVNTSYDNFGFTNPYNRFQIVSLDIMNIDPMEHIHTIYIDTESALNFALKVIDEISQGYQMRQYRRQ